MTLDELIEKEKKISIEKKKLDEELQKIKHRYALENSPIKLGEKVKTDKFVGYVRDINLPLISMSQSFSYKVQVLKRNGDLGDIKEVGWYETIERA